MTVEANELKILNIKFLTQILIDTKRGTFLSVINVFSIITK